MLYRPINGINIPLIGKLEDVKSIGDDVIYIELLSTENLFKNEYPLSNGIRVFDVIGTCINEKNFTFLSEIEVSKIMRKCSSFIFFVSKEINELLLRVVDSMFLYALTI